MREQYWSELSEEERARAIEIGQPLLEQYTQAVTGPALKKELRKARRYMISGRINRGANVVVPGPYGMATVIRGHDFYAEKFWNAERYQEWIDDVWTDPPKENVDVGAPITIGVK